MKLWWPQAEAMVAYAKAYATTLDPVHLAKLQLVADWVYAHLVDSKQGEWWGYSDRNGVVTHRFKGGAYKGCFHVPRALLLVDQALGRAIARLEVCA
jgi:N-acylglucosamine 2-epimerase